MDPLDYFEPQPLDRRLTQPFIRPDDDTTGGVLTTLLHHGLRQTIPTAGGVAAFAPSAEIGGAVGLAVGGPWGGAIGGIGGGLLGSMGGGWLLSKAQDKLLSMLPDDTLKAIGQDDGTRAAEERFHPYASFAGDIAPQLLFMRPGWNGKLAAAGGAAIAGGVEAGSEYANDGRIDPFKVGAQAVLGAALGRNTKLGDLVQAPAARLTNTIRSGFGKTPAGMAADATIAEQPPGLSPDHATPDEQAAVHVQAVEGFDRETNPYGDSVTGVPAHASRLTEATEAAATGRAPDIVPAVVSRVPFDRWSGAIEQVESRGNPDAVSPKGARGRMQVMDATNRDPGYGVTPARDDSAAERMRVGQDYLAALDRHYGDQMLATAAYNAGPGRVDKWLRLIGDPRKGEISPEAWAERIPIAETRNYVRDVFAHMGQDLPQSPVLRPDLMAEADAAPQEPVDEISGPEPGAGPQRLADGSFRAIDAEGQFGAKWSARGGWLATDAEGNALVHGGHEYGTPPKLYADADTAMAAAPKLRRIVDPNSEGGSVEPAPSPAPAGQAPEDWSAAVDRLRRDQAGEAREALWNPETGPIDVLWGDPKGGFQHIVEKHPEVVDDLPELIAGMRAGTRESDNRIRLYGPEHTAVVRLERDGAPRRWLLTAFAKEKSAPAPTEDGRAGGGDRDDSPDRGAASDIGEGGGGGNASAVETYSDPDGEGTNRQLDLLEHDLRMMIEADPALTVRLDAEGDVVNIADRLASLDEEGGVLDALRSCLTPGGTA